MSEYKNRLEQLQDINNGYEYDPMLCQNVIAELDSKPVKQTQKRTPIIRLAFISAPILLVLCICLSIFVFTPPQDEFVYYDNEKTTVADITDINAFITENNYNFKYFTESTATNKYYTITDTNNFAYLNQEYTDIYTIDSVSLYVKVLNNAGFDFEKFYEGCNTKIIISNIVVLYTNNTNIPCTVKAKFSIEGAEYFLEIKTYFDAQTQIEYYINLLLGN